MTTLSLKPEFGWVLGTAAASYIVHHIYMASKVMKARKKFDVQYPALYADEKNCPNEAYRQSFNCVQRAHQNSLEGIGSFHLLLLASGLQYPITAASFGALYLVGRVGYAEGYSTGDPKKRINYVTGLGIVGILGLLGTTLKAAYDLLAKK